MSWVVHNEWITWCVGCLLWWVVLLMMSGALDEWRGSWWLGWFMINGAFWWWVEHLLDEWCYWWWVGHLMSGEVHDDKWGTCLMSGRLDDEWSVWYLERFMFFRRRYECLKASDMMNSSSGQIHPQANRQSSSRRVSHLRPHASSAHRLDYNACNCVIFLLLIMPLLWPIQIFLPLLPFVNETGLNFNPEKC